MIIKNAKIFTTDGFKEGNLIISGERITGNTAEAAEKADSADKECNYACRQAQEASDSVEEVIDAAGLMAIPGLVDIHFHGAMGKDFCDAKEDSIQTIADFEASQGVLAICPATMTYTEEILTPIMEAAAAHKNGRGADLVGINMEGPFISPGKVGAQNPAYVMGANGPMFDRLQEKSGKLIKLVDIAPEESDNLAFIKEYADKVRISVAHTCTDYDTAKRAFANGAKHCTHLYNAMPGINHRNPGPIIAALEEGATVELIADGIHIHPAVVRFTFQVFGADKVILISDSLESTGLRDGSYMLGGQPITVRGRRAVLSEHPDTIAGSSSSLFDCLKCAVTKMQVPAAVAVRAATVNPAKAIGIDSDYGSLNVGRYANVLLLNEQFEIVRIIQKGK